MRKGSALDINMSDHFKVVVQLIGQIYRKCQFLCYKVNISRNRNYRRRYRISLSLAYHCTTLIQMLNFVRASFSRSSSWELLFRWSLVQIYSRLYTSWERISRLSNSTSTQCIWLRVMSCWPFKSPWEWCCVPNSRQHSKRNGRVLARQSSQILQLSLRRFQNGLCDAWGARENGDKVCMH